MRTVTTRRDLDASAPGGGVGRILVAVGGAYLLAWLLGLIPAPADPSAFWAGNMAWPYVVVPGLLAWWSAPPRLVPMIWRGAVAGAAMIAGFYRVHAVWRVSADQLDMALGASGVDVVVEAYRRWLANFVLGDPGGIPWLTFGVMAGALSAALVWLALGCGLSLAWWLLVFIPVLEAAFHLLTTAVAIPGLGRYDLRWTNLALWLFVAACSVGVGATAGSSARRPRLRNRA